MFVGVSGSGKSSIVFDTVAVEAQRQLATSFPWSIRNQLPKYERPHVDAVENLTTPVIVDQRPLGGNARSTVGTITDVYSMIRALFSRYARGYPRLFVRTLPARHLPFVMVGEVERWPEPMQDGVMGCVRTMRTTRW